MSVSTELTPIASMDDLGKDFLPGIRSELDVLYRPDRWVAVLALADIKRPQTISGLYGQYVNPEASIPVPVNPSNWVRIDGALAALSSAQLVERTGSGESGLKFQALPAATDVLPLIGVLASWSLAHPEIPYKSIVGGGKTARIYPPEAAYTQVFTARLRALHYAFQEGGIHTGNVCEITDRDHAFANKVLNGLTRDTMMLKLDRANPGHRSITLTEPLEESRLSVAESRLLPETIAVRKAARQLYEQGIFEIGADELIAAALKFDATIDAEVLWLRIRSTQLLYGIESEVFIKGRPTSRKSEYYIEESKREAIQNLLLGLASLRDRTFKGRAAEVAQIVTRDKDSVHQLLQGYVAIVDPVQQKTAEPGKTNVSSDLPRKPWRPLSASLERVYNSAIESGVPDWLVGDKSTMTQKDANRLHRLELLFSRSVLYMTDDAKQLQAHPNFKALFTPIERSALAYACGYDTALYGVPIPLSYLEQRLKTPGGNAVRTEAALWMYLDTFVMPRIVEYFPEVPDQIEGH